MNFLTALKKRRDAGPFPVIPDIKSFSPKEGDLLRGRAPVSLALQLEAAGACVLSVVTEEREFHGSMDILRQICRGRKPAGDPSERDDHRRFFFGISQRTV